MSRSNVILFLFGTDKNGIIYRPLIQKYILLANSGETGWPQECNREVTPTTNIFILI